MNKVKNHISQEVENLAYQANSPSNTFACPDFTVSAPMHCFCTDALGLTRTLGLIDFENARTTQTVVPYSAQHMDSRQSQFSERFRHQDEAPNFGARVNKTTIPFSFVVMTLSLACVSSSTATAETPQTKSKLTAKQPPVLRVAEGLNADGSLVKY